MIKIYSTPGCVNCRIAKEFMKEHDIKYTEINVADNPVGRKEMMDITGRLSVPVITIDTGQWMEGWDKSEFRGLLRAIDINID